jgi:hypothetical protein
VAASSAGLAVSAPICCVYKCDKNNIGGGADHHNYVGLQSTLNVSPNIPCYRL